MIRNANLHDEKILIKIFQDARKFMAKSGNPNQWKEDYPGSNFNQEIRKKEIYVIEEAGQIIGVFKLISHDTCYDQIEGKWLNERPYLAIHRVAKISNAKGVLSAIVEFTKTFTSNIKIDTHRSNTVMQKRLEKLGFKYCGIIYLENGEERLAYQLISQ